MADSDVQQIRPGMTQEQVKGLLGTPDTTSTIAPVTYYYMASTMKISPLAQAEETNRKILAVYFNPVNTVDQVANYTMKDGKVIDTIGRVTPSAHGDRSLIEKLFKGIGKKQTLFDPEKQ